MSKQMVSTFFPASVDRLGLHWLSSYMFHDVAFPDEVAQACPEYSLSLPLLEIPIRQPWLLLAALSGAWIGISTFAKSGKSTSQQTAWSFSFLSFGIMNLSAVFLHCMWPAPSATDYPTEYPFFWAIDTYMTGVSSTCLMLASLKLCPQQLSEHLALPNNHLKQRLGVAMHAVGLLCIVWFIGNPAPTMVRASRPLELWYLIPPFLAGPPLVWVLYGTVLQKLPIQGWNLVSSLSLGQWSFLSAVGVISVGIGMDRFLCTLVGSLYGGFLRDLLSTNALAFWGCDIAFWSIGRCLDEQDQQARTRNDHSD